MPEIILITAVVAALGGLLYWVCTKLFKKAVEKTKIKSDQEQSILNDIIEVVYQQAHSQGIKSVNSNKISKVLLMERLNLSPKYLKEYISRLVSKDILTEDQNHVKITPFGVGFFKMFGKDARWRR